MVHRTIWSNIGLQSSIVCYTEPLFMPDVIWKPDLFEHSLGEKLVEFSKENLDFDREIIASEFQVKEHCRPASMYKT